MLSSARILLCAGTMVPMFGAFALALSAYAQPAESSMKFYEDFFAHLITNSPRLAQFHEPEELRLAHRLGIEYQGEANKFMIGYGFEQSARRLFREEGLRYTLTAESLDLQSRILKVEIPQLQLMKKFYFTRGRLVSPVSYYAERWHKRRTRFVEFWLSDSLLLHPVAAEELDRFIERMMDTLGYARDERNVLERQKVIYVLCRDEEEIEKLTGFRSRGMYLIPYDYVVTTFPCHFHEVAHVLINFKLRRLPLYTHPFLQEGFATALGGRGGIATGTLLQSGAFLVLNSAVDYRELFVAEKFRQHDPSISYAVSSLYVRFLLETLGMNRFLELYRKYGGTAEQVQRMMLHPDDLPQEQSWLMYVRGVEQKKDIRVDRPLCASSRTLMRHHNAHLEACGAFIRVRMQRAFALAPPREQGIYAGRLGAELGLDERFRSARFYVVANSQEVVVYDLFTGNSVASYSRAFSLDRRRVPSADGWYEFWMRQDLLPEELQHFRIITTEGTPKEF